MVVCNLAGKMKLNYNYIRDMILAKEVVHIRDSSEILSSGLALNIDFQGRRHDRSSSRNRGRRKSRSGQQITCWNYGKLGHIRRHCQNHKQTEDDTVNVVAEKMHDALFLAMHSPVDN